MPVIESDTSACAPPKRWQKLPARCCVARRHAIRGRSCQKYNHLEDVNRSSDWPKAAPSIVEITLFEPGIGAVVIAVNLPVPRRVLGRELDPLQPLRAFPEVEMRDDEANRPAVFPRQRLTLPCVRHDAVFGGEILQSDIRRVVIVAVQNDEVSFRLSSGRRRRNAGPAVISATITSSSAAALSASASMPSMAAHGTPRGSAQIPAYQS